MEIVLKVELDAEQMAMVTDIHGKLSRQIADLKGRVRRVEGKVTL